MREGKPQGYGQLPPVNVGRWATQQVNWQAALGVAERSFFSSLTTACLLVTGISIDWEQHCFISVHWESKKITCSSSTSWYIKSSGIPHGHLEPRSRYLLLVAGRLPTIHQFATIQPLTICHGPVCRPSTITYQPWLPVIFKLCHFLHLETGN